MRAGQFLETDQAPQEVASLLVPTANTMLLLPHASVAEIVPVGQIIGVDNAPPWLLGQFVWRELDLPLISLEVINGHERPAVGSRSRIAVLNTTGRSEALGFLAILTQGLPRLARVSAEELAVAEQTAPGPFDKLPVVWAGEEAVIPDIGKLEQAYLDLGL